MRILLAGASGFIGRRLAARLTDRGHEVTAAVRCHKAKRGGLPVAKYLSMDFTREVTPAAWRQRLVGADAVINAVGIIREASPDTYAAVHTQVPCALFEACANLGIRRVIQLSALGADRQANTAYHLSKRAADECLAATSLNWVIIRPSLVYGAGSASTALFLGLAALPWVPRIGNGSQTVQPIHVDDLVQALVRLVEAEAPSRVRVDAVGPTPLTFAEMLNHYRRWIGLKVRRTIDLPAPLVHGLARIGDWIPGSLLTRDNLRMLERGNTAAVEPFVELTGVRPRAMEDALIREPATTADRWYAGLYFLAPLLRISIGLLWLATGLVSLFVFPVETSFRMLARLGIEGTAASAVLYGAGILDVALGIATLAGIRLVWVGGAQILVILAYSLLITLGLPEFWVHPFGPVTKNLPIIVATLVMMVVGRRN